MSFYLNPSAIKWEDKYPNNFVVKLNCLFESNLLPTNYPTFTVGATNQLSLSQRLEPST